MTHEFSIGDIVKIRDYDSIPQDKKTKTAYGDPSLITPRKSSLCGKTVEIVDRLADFITDKHARVFNHYDLILKWYREDSSLRGTTAGK